MESIRNFSVSLIKGFIDSLRGITVLLYLDKEINERALSRSPHHLDSDNQKKNQKQPKIKQFNRKAQMRETWLSENQRLVSQDNFGFDLAAVEAAAKKHEAIETDIFAYEERVQAVVAVCSELQVERYHDMERVMARRDNVLRLWAYLLELLRARRTRLELSLQLQQNFQEMLYILDSMEEIKLRLLTDDYGKHLMGVEDLLQKHALVEADINVLGERVKVLADYIASRGLSSRGLRDEILVQLCNQASGNDAAAARVWPLMAHCLAAFQPGPPLHKYLVRFVSERAPSRERALLLRLLGCSGAAAARTAGIARRTPPTLLEWRSAASESRPAVPIRLYDGPSASAAVTLEQIQLDDDQTDLEKFLDS